MIGLILILKVQPIRSPIRAAQSYSNFNSVWINISRSASGKIIIKIKSRTEVIKNWPQQDRKRDRPSCLGAEVASFCPSGLTDSLHRSMPVVYFISKVHVMLALKIGWRNKQMQWRHIQTRHWNPINLMLCAVCFCSIIMLLLCWWRYVDVQLTCDIVTKFLNFGLWTEFEYQCSINIDVS